MMNTIEFLRLLCKRPKACNSEIETPEDLLAGIRGICMGVSDPQGEKCLGDFPIFVQTRFPEYGKDSWYITLSRLCASKSLYETCHVILHLINEWQALGPTQPTGFLLGSYYGDDAIDTNTFDLMEEVLRNPLLFVPGAKTLREILTFIWGICVGRHPPHGGIAGLDKFTDYVKQHFHNCLAQRMAVVLLNELNDYPFRDACLVITDLIRRWRDSRPADENKRGWNS